MTELRVLTLRKTFHVTYDTLVEQWMVGYGGARTAFSAHGTKEEAIQAGRELAQKQQPSRLIIHRLDGSVQTKHAYGADQVEAG